MVPTNELKDFPRSRWRGLAPALALIGLAVVMGTVLRPGERARARQVPDFELPLLSGKGTVSSEELEGSPVVLNFFASWCRPCIEEAPVLQRTYERYKDEGVRFIGVDIQDTEDNARAFVEEHGITYPVVKDYDRVLGDPLGVRAGLPQTFFVTQEWRLAGSEAGEEVASSGATASLGAISEQELERGIEELLDEE